MIYFLKAGGCDCFSWKMKGSLNSEKEKEGGKGFRPQFQSDLISHSKWAALQVMVVTDHKTLLYVRPVWPPACLDIFFPGPSWHSCQAKICVCEKLSGQLESPLAQLRAPLCSVSFADADAGEKLAWSYWMKLVKGEGDTEQSSPVYEQKV